MPLPEDITDKKPLESLLLWQVPIYILLTHIPVISTVFGLLMLTYVRIARKTEAAQVDQGTFVLSGLAAGAVQKGLPPKQHV